MADEAQERRVRHRIRVSRTLRQVPSACASQGLAGIRLALRLVEVRDLAREAPVVVDRRARGEDLVSPQHLRDRAHHLLDRRRRDDDDVARPLVLLDARERLRVADGLDRALERVLHRCLKECGVPAAPHAPQGLRHLLHAGLVRAREQVGQLNQDGGERGPTVHEAGLDEWTRERHV